VELEGKCYGVAMVVARCCRCEYNAMKRVFFAVLSVDAFLFYTMLAICTCHSRNKLTGYRDLSSSPHASSPTGTHMPYSSVIGL